MSFDNFFILYTAVLLISNLFSIQYIRVLFFRRWNYKKTKAVLKKTLKKKAVYMETNFVVVYVNEISLIFLTLSYPINIRFVII